MRRIFKIIIIIVIINILFLSSIFLGFWNSLIKKSLESSVNKILNGTLEIKSITGNPFNKLNINNVTIKDKSDNFILINKLGYNLDLLKLFFLELNIKEIFIDEIYVFLKENDKRWNFQDLLIETSKKENKKEKESKGFPIKIILQDFLIKNSKISIETNNKKIPSEINDLFLQLNLKLVREKLDVKFEKFCFKTNNPNLYLNDIFFNIEYNDKTVNLDKFILDSSITKINGEAKGNIEKHFNLDFSFYDVNYDNLREIIPNFPLYGSPIIKLNSNLNKQLLETVLKIDDSNQSIKIDSKIDFPFEEKKYLVNGDFKHVDLSKLLNNNELNSDLNLNFLLKGKGINPKSLVANLDLFLTETKFNDYQIKSLNLFVKKDEEKLNFGIYSKNEFADIDIKGNLFDINKNPRYNTFVKLYGLDLAVFTNNRVNSNLNIKLNLNGSNIKKPNIVADIKMEDSRILSINNLNLESSFKYNNYDYKINFFDLKSNICDIKINGSGNIKKESHLDFSLDIKKLNELDKYIKIDAYGNVNGTFAGSFENPKINVNANLKNIKYDSIQIEKLNTFTKINKKNKKFYGDINLEINNSRINEFDIKKIFLSSNIKNKNIFCDLHIDATDSLKTNLIAKAFIDENRKIIEIPKFDILFFNNLWENKNKIDILINGNNLDCKNFNLNSKNQKLNITAKIDEQQNYDVKLKLDSLNVKNFNFLSPYKIDGIINSDIKLSGNKNNPNIDLRLLVNNGYFNKYSFKKLKINTIFKDFLIKTELDFFRNEVDSLVLFVSLPVKIKNNFYDIDKEKNMNLELKTNDFDLNYLTGFLPYVSLLEGKLFGDLKVTNNIDNPIFKGFLKINDGKIKIPLYGVEYDYIFDFNVDKNSFVLEKMNFYRDKGKFEFFCSVDFDNGLKKNLTNFNIDVNAKDFYLCKNDHIQILLESDIYTRGDMRKPIFGGNITLLRTMIDIDALLPNFDSKANFKPLLVEALADTFEVKKDKVKKKKVNFDFLDNLRGSIKLNVPKNTWIRNNDMNVELMGDILIKKEGKFFELFGPISVIRGDFTLYGRKFNLKDGTVTFSGSNINNAVLDLKLAYLLRDNQRNKKTLLITVTKTIKSPKIDFYLDDELLEEKDAISYLLFGKSTKSNSYAENSEMNEKISAMGTVTNIIVEQISGKLTDSLGKALNLDVIEINNDGGFKNANIVIGKYLTNNLFASYKKGLNITSNNQSNDDEFTVEYEIFKNLILQAKKGDKYSSGFDFFIKFKK